MYKSVLVIIQGCIRVSDSSLAAAVARAPFDLRFDPRQRRHLIHAQLVSQLIRVQLVLLEGVINKIYNLLHHILG